MTDEPSTLVSELIDRDAVDPDGDKIGNIFDVYLDDASGQPEWLAVSTGLFGSKVSFVPIAGAHFVDDDLQVAYSKDVVKDAPRAEPDGQLSPDEEDALYAHYGQSAAPSTDEFDDRDVEMGAERRDDPGGNDVSGSDTDAVMTRSEEELDVNTSTRQAGVARLRKWVETEHVSMTVPIRREKARLVVEPVTDANRDDALAARNLSDEEHEVVLSEEVVDVSKTVVPKERVRLETEVETDEVRVDEEIRKERIAMEEGGERPEQQR